MALSLLGSMECLAGNGLNGDEVNLNNRNNTSLSSELPFSPFLAKFFLQENDSLTMIPPYFFQPIPVLQVLDLSRTSIQSFPPSIERLCLLETLILQECSLLMEVPPEVGALKNLKLFDLEGTELMYLPEQIGELETLEHLRVSLSACADDQKDRYCIQYIIPRMMISKLSKLKELSIISVDPEAEWWEVELLEAIMGDLPFLPEIKTLKLYLPTAKALQQFLRLERFQVPIYSSLGNYRFIIGRCEQLPFSVQLDIEQSFLKLEKCVKYMNGEGYTNETLELIRDAKALYLRRHWTAEKLTVFDTRRLKYCLLMECNELQTLVDQGDLYEHKNRSTGHSEDEILGSLQYLSIHFMKKLQRISKGRIGRNSLSCLRILALHTCPMLTSIFTGCLLGNMQSLTELIVEDCPKVKCLVDLGEVTPRSNGPFLLSLRRVSLIDLPELVSISGGISIAPQLDTLLIFNCMKLNYLSDMEIPRDTKAIKGEIEWWDALKDGKLTWHNVFVQLKRDGGLMDQLAEDTNSLKHFLDLEMIPSNHGSDQNSLMDHHLGCNYMSTKEDLEHIYSSVPPYLDHHNWHLQLQQSNHQQASVGGGENHNLPPPPPPPQPGVGGGGSSGEGSIRSGSMVDRARMAKLPMPEPGLNCPRCNSTNTKFCYFNNYSLQQPRHFCKTCRRYWTRGGALRTVPVGGGCRRNKRNNKNRSSKSPSQTGLKSSESPSRCSTETMASTQLPHPPSLQMPFMSSMGQYGGIGGSIGSNLGGLQPHNEMGNFQLGTGSSNGNNFNNILSIGGAENWRLPFLAGFEVPNNTNLFHYQSEGVVEAQTPSSSMVGGDMRIQNSEIDNTPVDPPVKMEDNRDSSLSRQFLGVSETTNQQPWVGNWAEFSGVNSTSTTPTTHFL